MSHSRTPRLQGQHTPPRSTANPVLVDGRLSWNYLTLAGAYVPYPLPCSVGSSPNTRCPRPAGWCSFARLGTHHIRSGFWNSYEIHSTLPPCQICQCVWSLSRSVALFSPTLKNGNDGPSDFYTRQFLLNSTPSEIR